MPQKKKEDKIPVPRVSASRAKTSDPAPPTPSAASNGAATAVAKVKAASSKTASSKIRKTSNGAAMESLLNLNGAVNGLATAAQIAERAYFLWLEKGCPQGTADQDWVEAERLLTAH
jgi:Protein of unknown function (DUF2934)